MDAPPILPTPPTRWKRRLALFLVAVLALVGLAPLYSGPILRAWIVRTLEERLAAQATLQSASFSWPARVHLRGLELLDENGARLLAVDEVRASVRLGPLFERRFAGEVEIRYPELHLAKTSAGAWNWQRLLERAQGPPSSRSSGAESAALPAIEARLSLRDGHIVVHGPSQETTLEELAVEVTLEGLERPAAFRLAFGVRGPGGAGGRLALDGNLALASAGRIDPEHWNGEAHLALETLDFHALAPAGSLVADLHGLGGVLEGKGEFHLREGFGLEGKAELSIRDFELQGPLASEPARIERIELAAEASQSPEGAGKQSLELHAGPVLALNYAGSTAHAGEVLRLEGELKTEGDLARWAEIGRGWVKFQEGVSVAGRANGELWFAGGLEHGEPASLEARFAAGLRELSARDAAGRTLDLSALEAVALELALQADYHAATLRVPKAELRAGKLVARGQGAASGLVRGSVAPALAWQTAELHVEADLGELQRTVERLIELESDTLGGSLTADLALEPAGGEWTGVLDGRALRFFGTSVATLGGNLRAKASDHAWRGQGTLMLGTLTLSGTPARVVPPSRVTIMASEEPTGTGAHELEFTTSAGGLSLRVSGQSRREAQVIRLDETLELGGRLATLASMAGVASALQPGLDGRVALKGTAGLEFADGPRTAAADLELRLGELTASDPAAAVPLALLGELRLALQGSYDFAAARAAARALMLEGNGVRVEAAGALSLRPAGLPKVEEGVMHCELDLERLGPALGKVVDLGGLSVAGRPLVADLRGSITEETIQVAGRLATPLVVVQRADGAPLQLADLGIDLDLGYDSGLGSLHVQAAKLHSRSLSLGLEGTLNQLLDPARARGVLRLEVGGELERILADFGLETPGRKTSGALQSAFAVEGDQGAFHLDGNATLENLHVVVDGATAEEKPLELEEPKLTVACDARIALASLDVDLAALKLDSTLARGGAQGRIENLRDADGAGARFRELRGEFAYVPDRLGAVLAPYLPGKWSGAEEQRLTFSLDGPAREFDLATLLAQSETHVDLGLGRFERPEVALGGTLRMDAKAQKANLRGELSANEGTLEVVGAFDLRPAKEEPLSRLSVAAKAVRANAGLAPLLACLHPAFNALTLAQGSLDGLISLNLDLTYPAALDLAQLQADWTRLPKEPLQGTGRLALEAASIRGSPLLELLSELGIDTQRSLDLKPIEFTIQKGRLLYARPWTWSFSGTETNFTGSVGLDQSLELNWNVPVNDQLVRRFAFLDALRGEVIQIPLRGTLRSPKLDTAGVMKELATTVAERELAGRLGLGGGRGEDPSELLKRADTLWGQGQKREAAALYLRLRDEFKLSLVYALNKDRIKERAKYKDER